MTPPLTAADLLKVGAWFARDGQRFEITAWDARSPLQVEARAEGTDASQAFTLTDLFAPTPVTRFAASRAELLARPGSAPAVAVDVAAVPAHLLQRAERLLEIVEAVQAALAQPPLPAANARSLTERTRQACQALPTPISLSA